MKELEKENEDLETQIEYRRKQNASMTLMNHEDECDGRGERSPSEGEPLSSVVVFGSSVQCAFSEISGQHIARMQTVQAQGNNIPKTEGILRDEELKDRWKADVEP